MNQIDLSARSKHGTRIQIRYPQIGGMVTQRDIDAVAGCLQDATGTEGSFFPGDYLSQFERKVAEYECASEAVAVSSCGAALEATLAVLEIGAGDEVITTGLTFAGTACAVVMRGARPVLADIDEQTFNLSPQSVAARITSRTKAIIPVHYAGLCCDVEEFESISKAHGVPVIYDAAHALGARFRGRGIGAYGFATCYSFQYHKHMTCLGEGGAITTADAKLAAALRQLRSFGFDYPSRETYDGGVLVRVGSNMQMTRPQLAAGCSQIDNAGDLLVKRRELFRYIADRLGDVPGLKMQAGIGEDHACLMFTVCVAPAGRLTRDRFRHVLLEEFGVETKIHYAPLWKHAALTSIAPETAQLANCARIAEEIVSLPVHPLMPFHEADYLIWACRSAMRG